MAKSYEANRPDLFLSNRIKKILARSTGYIFILPYLIFLILFGINPAIYALVVSFLKGSLDNQKFAALENFDAVFKDTRVISSFVNIFSYIGVWIPLMILIVPLLALLLHIKPSRLTSGIRMVYYLPNAITGVASVLIWLFMFNPQVSPFGFILKAVGFKSINEVLARDRLALAYAVMALFTGAGSWIVTCYGALQGISREVLEAAEVEGCNAFQAAIYIKLPMISKYIIYMVVLTFAAGFQLLAEPQIINQASGGTLGGVGWSPNVLAFDYASNALYGRAGALSLILLAICLSIALILIYKTDFYKTDFNDEG